MTHQGDNQIAMVVRWRTSLLSFDLKVQRIPGTSIGFVGYISRMYSFAALKEDSADYVLKRNM
jgi:hypothetical protein